MSPDAKREGKNNRRLRLGMVGGGPGGFIGAVHRIAARLDDRFELVAAALSSDPARARSAALDLHIAPDRAYASFAEMASAEAARKDRIDAVSIVVPNHLHYPVAKAFLNAGIHVICDKPLTTTLEDAIDLAQTVRRTGLLFAVTHNYTGHPMVRQARQLIADDALGPIRVVQVEYAQDWLSTPLEKTGQKQALWRTDPAQSGPGGSLGDIGTHAFNLASFVTRLNCRELAAELSTFVPGRRVDDNVQIMLRFAEGARGMLWASQVAPGNQNNLRLRVFGEKAGLEWKQEEPNCLWFAELGKAPALDLPCWARRQCGCSSRQSRALGSSRRISGGIRATVFGHGGANHGPHRQTLARSPVPTGSECRGWRGRNAFYLRRDRIAQPERGLDAFAGCRLKFA